MSNIKKLRKPFATVLLLMLAVTLLALLGLKIYCKLPQENPSGILLSFDDYYEENWEQNFDLFDEYDANVTFFINAGEPTEFCYKAMERGHEIGFHTTKHVNLVEASEEEIWAEAIAPIEVFRKAGIEFTSFAYPYGASSLELDELLLQHYNVVRGGFLYELMPKEKLKKGYVEAKPIDNEYFSSELQFRWVINKMLYEARFNEGTVVSMYTHGVEWGDWCITPPRLEYILKKAKELNLEFYTYKELQ